MKPLSTPEQLPCRYWPSLQAALLHGWQTAPSTGLHCTASQKSWGHVGHAWQVAAPVSFAKYPSAHGSHVAAPALPAAVPTLHSMQADSLLLPGTGLALPGSHARHQLLLEAPKSGL